MSRIVTLTAMVGALALALIAAPAALAGDSVGAPTELLNGVAEEDYTASYTIQPGEPNTINSQFLSTCGSAQSVGVAHSAWYVVKGTGGLATVTTASSDFNTALFAYDRYLSGAGIACNDDSDGALTSAVTFNTVRGYTYYVQAGSFCTSTAACLAANGGTLRITATTAPDPDTDGDGITGTAMGGADCNDNDLRIHPGALDVPGDGIDQNCDGRDAAVARPTTVHTTISLTSSVHKAYTRIAKLTARNVPAGATLTVSCATRAAGSPPSRRACGGP